jgi:hypothetical protein
MPHVEREKGRAPTLVRQASICSSQSSVDYFKDKIAGGFVTVGSKKYALERLRTHPLPQVVLTLPKLGVSF